MPGLSDTLYITELPPPGEASINVLQQVAKTNALKPKAPTMIQSVRSLLGLSSKDEKKPRTFNMALSSIESPSSRLAMDLFFQEVSQDETAHVIATASVGTPDPREPMANVKYRLWHYDDINPSPALPEPDVKIAGAVGLLALKPFDIKAWTSEAGITAAKLGPKMIPDLLAAMVHPQRHPAKFPIWIWLQRLQIAAALIIAGFEHEEEWKTSECRKALYSLAFGPMDWTTGAAILALTQLALKDETIEAELIKALQRIMDNRPDQGAVCYESLMAHCALRLPHLPASMRTTMQEKL